MKAIGIVYSLLHSKNNLEYVKIKPKTTSGGGVRQHAVVVEKRLYFCFGFALDFWLSNKNAQYLVQILISKPSLSWDFCFRRDFEHYQHSKLIEKFTEIGLHAV